MTHSWRRIMTVLGFVGCLAMVAPACVIRASGRVRAKPVRVVDESPPPPRYRDDIRQKPGFVWIRGHWEWRSNDWVWIDGHWERVRKGYEYREGRWEKRGNRWHWVEGEWVAIGTPGQPRSPRVVKLPRRSPAAYPTNPPPDPKVVKSPRDRPGYVWIRGHWEWRNGDWAWIDGHWERARAGYAWESGRWEQRGDRYVWVEGRWLEAKAPRPKVRDHRRKGPTSPPPDPKVVKSPRDRPGYVWIRGHWEWRDGDWAWINGHWERARRGYHWKPGEWVLQGGIYVWVEGSWVQGGPARPRVRDHRDGQ